MLSPWSRSWRRALGFSALGWVLLAAVRTGLRIAAIPRPFGVARAIFGQVLLASLPWLFLAPVIVMIAIRLDWRPGHRRRTAGIHLALAVAMSLLDSGWGWMVLPWAGYPMKLSPGLWYLVRLDQALFIYLCLAGIGVALRHRRRSHHALLRAARLEAQLVQARLHILTLQLHPHFLFNALNAVSELVHRDPAGAREMLKNLGELLRRSLDGDAAQEVPLREELALLEPYRRIQRTRFADSLAIVTDAAHDTLDALVPRLIIQPLVENAIRHGTARRAGPGRIVVRARAETGRLMVEVEDDGVGLGGSEAREGVGLRNTRARLEQLHGARAQLLLLPAPGAGTVARLEFPLSFGTRPGLGDPEIAEAFSQDQPADHVPVPITRMAAGIAAGWLAVALTGAQEDFIASHLAGAPERFSALLPPRVGEAGLWLALTPVVVWLASRLASSSVRWPALIAAHLGAGLATIAVHLALVYTLLNPAMDGTLIATYLVNDICIYAALSAGAHAWTTRGIAARRQAAAAGLDAELATARVEQLRWRLRPTLLFGALQRIGELAADHPDQADELTGRLGELLRLMLQSACTDWVPLARELAVVSSYLEVEGGVRSLSMDLEVDLDEDARSVPVPAMLLQPLVEMLGGVRVRVSGSVREDALELTVRNRPAALESDDPRLLDLHRRLQLSYGAAYRLVVRRSGDEAAATFHLPLFPATEARAVA